MDTQKILWKVRTKAFLVQFGSMLVVALTGVVSSAQFKELVTENFGASFAAGASLLFITGLASHIANRMALKQIGSVRSTTFGGETIKRDDIILI